MVNINILTRTSNRPNGFKICADSIKKQDYLNITHIVAYDNDNDLEYINKNDDIIKIKVDREELIKNDTSNPPSNHNLFWFSPHNLYCNTLLDNVQDGWILFLDDDDMLIDNNVISEIVSLIEDEDTIMIWQMMYPNGKCLPNNHAFTIKTPMLGNIGSPCFLFHSKWKDHYRWDAYKCGDFIFIDKLYKTIPKNKWINKPFIRLNNMGGLGKRIDI